MSGKVKGITVEIGGDTKGLDKAIKSVNSEIRSTSNELKQVERLLKLDPQNTELLAQKQLLLGNNIETVKEKLEALKSAKDKADQDMANGTEVNQTQYRKLQREIVQTEQDLKTLNTKADQSKVKFDALGKSAESMNSFMRKAGVAAIGAGAGLVTMGLKAAAAADDINTLATQTGLSTDQIQIFQYASERIDVSLETLTGSLKKLTKNMYSAQQGSKNQKEAFKALGVTIVDSEGKLRNNQDVMNDCINALANMENETQRDAYAMQIFGKSAQDLNPLILGGADALNQMAEEARASGIILDEETLQSANRLNDAVDTLKATATGAFSKIGAEIAEGLTPYIEPLAGMIAAFGNFIVQNQDAIVTALGAIGAALLAFNIATTIQGVILKFIEFKKAIMAVTTAQEVLNLVMSTNVIALVVAAVAALVATFVILWNKCESFRKFWTGLWEGIKTVASTVWEAITGFFTAAWNTIQGIWAGAQSFFSGVLEGIQLVFSVVQDVLSAYFQDAWVAIQMVWSGVVGYFQMVWENIKLVFAVVKDVLSGDFSGAWEAIKQIWSNVKSFFSGVWENIKSAFNISQIVQIGRDLLTGLWNGINDKVAWLKGKVKGVVDTIKSWFTGKDGFDEHSPSKWSKQVGVYIDEGLQKGIAEGKNEVLNEIKSLTEDSRTEVQKVMDEMNEELLESEQKYLDESERLKDSKSDADKKYLEKLKDAADKERKIYDALQKDIENSKQAIVNDFKEMTDEAFSAMEDIESAQKSIADKMDKDTTYSTYTLMENGVEQEHYVLGDGGEEARELENYSKLIDKLFAERGELPDQVLEFLSGMDMEEGTNYINAMLNATDEQFDAYIENLQKEAEYADKVSKQLTSNQLADAVEEFEEKFSEMPEDFFQIGEDSAIEYGEGFMSQIESVYTSIREKMLDCISSLQISSDMANGIFSSIGTAVNNTSNSYDNSRSTQITINNPVPVASAYAERLEVEKLVKNLAMQGVL